MARSTTTLPLQLLATAIAIATACNRVPEEPAPAASTRAQSAATPPAPSIASATRADGAPPEARGDHVDRCIVPTSTTPPPPVPRGPAPNCPRDPEGAGSLLTVTLQAPEAASGATSITAEVARTEAQRERGLMYRTSMADDHGMIFDMGQHTIHRFWMQNTCIPLDMLFIDQDGLIVGILENVPTMNTEERAVRCASSYVLEMNAGWSRKHGVRAGQRLVLPML